MYAMHYVDGYIVHLNSAINSGILLLLKIEYFFYSYNTFIRESSLLKN